MVKMEKSAFLARLALCFTEREINNLSSRAIHGGLDEDQVMRAADRRLSALLMCDMDDDYGRQSNDSLGFCARTSHSGGSHTYESGFMS